MPAKVSEDDKLEEYDVLLLDRFLDFLQDLYGNELKKTVKISAFCRLLVFFLLDFLLIFGLPLPETRSRVSVLD